MEFSTDTTIKATMPGELHAKQLAFLKGAKTKKAGELRIIQIGDVHLGRGLKNTKHIEANLNKFCYTEENLAWADLLVIEGDFFDRLLQNSDEQIDVINRHITLLLYKCKKHKVMILVVEGTPSHDWKQSRFFIEQARNAGIEVEIHYETKLAIQYIAKFDINVLYVPDKLKADTAELFEDVKALLAKHNLEKVDIAIMHGAFKHQMPYITKEPPHDEASYQSIVRVLIMIGHVHTPSQFENILAAGSFDRGGHGEEHAKGFNKITIYSDYSFKAVFVENKGAMRYVTLDCKGMSLTEVNDFIDRKTKGLPSGSGVRLLANPNEPITGDKGALRAAYPFFEWKIEIEKDKTAEQSFEFELFDQDFDEMDDITPDTIQRLLEKKFTEMSIPLEQQLRLQELVKDLK